MLTIPANWTTAYSKACPVPRVLVRIYTASGTYSQFSDGPCDQITQLDAPISVVEVGVMSRELDVTTHKANIGTCDIVLRMDPAITSLIASNGLMHTGVAVLLGEQSLAVADFVNYYAGVVSGVTYDETTVTIELTTREWLVVQQRDNYRYFGVSDHPLEILSDLYNVVTGYPINGVSTTTYSATRHWIVQAAPPALASLLDSKTAKKPLAMADEILAMIDGAVVCQEDGLPYYVAYDGAAASVKDWTDDDMSDFEIVELYDNMVNRVVVKSHLSEDRYLATTTLQDTTAQSRYAQNWTAAATPTIREKVFEFSYLRGVAYLESSMTSTSPAAGATFGVRHPTGLVGLCGTLWSGFPSGSQVAADQISASRKAYIAVANPLGGDSSEIVSCSALTIDNTHVGQQEVWDATIPTGRRTVTSPIYATYTVSARGAVDTTGAAHTVSVSNMSTVECFDVTIPYAVCQRVLNRFANGCPVVKIRVPISNFNVQIGDTVTITTDRFHWYGYTSATTAIKWEVIGKECQPYNDVPSIQFTLAFSYLDSALTKAWVGAYQPNKAASMAQVIQRPSPTAAGSSFRPAVRSGQAATYTIGESTFAIAEGYQGNGVYTSQGQAVSFDVSTLTSKDIYYARDVPTGAILQRSVAAGGAAPGTLTSEAALYKVTTNASGKITAVTDLRETTSVPATALSIDASSIGANVVGVYHENLERETAGGVPNGDLTCSSRAIATYPPDDIVTVRTNTLGAYVDDSTLWGSTRDVYAEASTIRTGNQGLKIDPKDPARVQYQKLTKNRIDLQLTPLTMTIAPTPGNTLVLIKAGYGNITSITQSGCVWSQAREQNSTFSELRTEIWYAPNIGTAGTTINLTYDMGNSYGQSYMLIEYEGILRSSPLDTYASGTAASGTSTTTNAGTTTANGDMLVAAHGCDHQSRVWSSPAAGWTLVDQLPSTNAVNTEGVVLALVQKVAGAAGSETSTLTIDSSTEWACVLAAFQRVTDPGVRTEDPIPITEGDVYEAEIDLRASDAAASYTCRMQWLQADKATSAGTNDVTSTVPGGAGVWYRQRITAEAPSGARYLQLIVSQDETTAGITYIDRIKLRPVGHSFRAYRATAVQSVASGSAVKIEYNAESHDYGSGFDAVTNYNFTAPVAGEYAFEATAQVASLGDGKQAYAAIYIAGSEGKRGATIINGSGGAADVVCEVAIASVYLAAGDAVDVRLTHNEGSNLDVALGLALTSFSGRQKL